MILEAIIIGLILSKFFNGNFDNFNKFNLKGKSLIVIGIISNLLIILFTSYDFKIITYTVIKYYEYFHIISFAVLIIGLLFNYDNFGIILISIGLILNLVPIILNGKMPVDYEALLLTNNNRLIDIISKGRSLSHIVLDNPKARILSDIIAITSPYPMPKVISIGDILISVGLICSLILISRRKS
ncbi:DUF5317 domain-containing protein [Peptoniphilus sp. oral taxon 386]|uniref:DUF5317 domain-containing protein n=1 Tax=Peptoniphilus sp. oral taxon 386 TaxID=652713 RepID=UPI0001DA9C60|nr:DUF5317 domain-containing protein [Peptoniphilus sp. oral taxon 386]EFI42210.1 hypothetical protein HMPREF0629_00851 [Peptoniphilus sp. oral taxon 386 str. F0131]